MLSTLLAVLKIIGIILLVIILVLIALLCAVLFIPVRYRSIMSKSDQVCANVVFHWFFHIVHAVGTLVQTDFKFIVRVFGIKVYQYPPTEKMLERQKRKDERRKKRAAGKKKNVAKKQDLLSTDEETGNHSKTARIEEIHGNDTNETVSKEPVEKHMDRQELPVEAEFLSDEEEAAGFFQKWYLFLKHLWKQIPNMLKKLYNIKYTIRKIYDKIKDVYDNIKYYLDLIRQKRTKEVVGMLKMEIPKLWKHVKPRKFRADVRMGFDDPMVTGELFGLICSFYPVFGENVVVIPEFERVVLEGRVFMRGRIRLFTVLWIGQKLYFDRNLRILMKQIKREDMTHGRK